MLDLNCTFIGQYLRKYKTFEWKNGVNHEELRQRHFQKNYSRSI